MGSNLHDYSVRSTSYLCEYHEQNPPYV